MEPAHKQGQEASRVAGGGAAGGLQGRSQDCGSRPLTAWPPRWPLARSVSRSPSASWHSTRMALRSHMLARVPSARLRPLCRPMAAVPQRGDKGAKQGSKGCSVRWKMLQCKDTAPLRTATSGIASMDGEGVRARSHTMMHPPPGSQQRPPFPHTRGGRHGRPRLLHGYPVASPPRQPNYSVLAYDKTQTYTCTACRAADVPPSDLPPPRLT